jgi:hypothetical protein
VRAPPRLAPIGYTRPPTRETTLARTTRSEAEARYAKAQKRAKDAAKAMSEAELEAKRIDENTARLRALRLARDAKEAAEAGAKPAKKSKPRAKKPKA